MSPQTSQIRWFICFVVVALSCQCSALRYLDFDTTSPQASLSSLQPTDGDGAGSDASPTTSGKIADLTQSMSSSSSSDLYDNGAASPQQSPDSGSPQGGASVESPPASAADYDIAPPGSSQQQADQQHVAPLAADNQATDGGRGVSGSSLTSLTQILTPRRTSQRAQTAPSHDSERARSTGGLSSSSSSAGKEKLASEEAIIRLHSSTSLASALSSKRDDKVTKMHSDLDGAQGSSSASSALASYLSSQGLVKAMTDNRLARTMSTIGKSLAGNKYVAGAATASAVAALGYTAFTKLFLPYMALKDYMANVGARSATYAPFTDRNGQPSFSNGQQMQQQQLNDLMTSSTSSAPASIVQAPPTHLGHYGPSFYGYSSLAGPQDYTQQQQQQAPSGANFATFDPALFQQASDEARLMQRLSLNDYLQQRQYTGPDLVSTKQTNLGQTAPPSMANQRSLYDQLYAGLALDQMQPSPSTLHASYVKAPGQSSYLTSLGTHPVNMYHYGMPSSSAPASPSGMSSGMGVPTGQRRLGQQLQTARMADENLQNQLLQRLLSSASVSATSKYANSGSPYFVSGSPIQHQQQQQQQQQQQAPKSDTQQQQQQQRQSSINRVVSSTPTVGRPASIDAVRANSNSYYQVEPASLLSPGQSTLNVAAVSNYDNNRRQSQQQSIHNQRIDNQFAQSTGGGSNEDNENLSIATISASENKHQSSKFSNPLASIDVAKNKFTPIRDFKPAQQQQKQQMVKLSDDDTSLASSVSAESSDSGIQSNMSNTGQELWPTSDNNTNVNANTNTDNDNSNSNKSMD